MIELKLTRYFSGKATMGVLSGSALPKPLFTLELPWKGNGNGVSCIPAGRYRFVPHGWEGEAVKYPRVWRLEDVPGRTGILIHIGNYTKDSLGCILPGTGMTISPDSNDCMVQRSFVAIEQLRKVIGNQGGYIEIVDSF